MAITDGKRLDEEPVGAGNHGIIKIFFTQLVATVEKEVFFGKFKLSDLEHNFLSFGVGTTGGAVVIQGVPDTTLVIQTDGESIKLEDVAGGAFAYMIGGVWTTRG